MAISTFTLGQLLGPSDLNNAFAQVLQLSTPAPQTIQGALISPNLVATIGLQTNDLNVSGDTIFASHSGIQLPVGNSLQRPFNGSAGWLRVNTDSGMLEVLLPSGNWMSVQTTTASQSPSTAPTSIASVQFGQASSTSIPLAWAPPIGGTAPFVYSVQYRLSGTSAWLTWVSELPATNSTIGGLYPGARYEMRVTCSNLAGSATSPISATNTLGYIAGGPGNVAVFSPTSTSLSVSWTPVPSSVPVAYVVRYGIATINTWTSITPISSTSTTLTGLTPNVNYNVQVIAQTTGGSFDSLVTQGTTTSAATVAPNAVGSLTFSAIGLSSLTVAWPTPTAGTPPFIYQLQYQFGGGATWYNYGPATTLTTLNLNNLNSGGVYSFRTIATNSLGLATSSPYPVTLLTTIAVRGGVIEYQSSGPTYPIIGAPQIGQLVGQSAIDIQGITVTDPMAAYLPGSMIVAVKCGTGTITMNANGSQITGSGTNSIAGFSTTLAGAQSTLATLSYTAAPAFGNVNLTDSITITVTDQAAQTSTLSVRLIIVPESIPVPTTPSPTPVSTTGYTSTGQPTDVAGTVANRVASFTGNIGVGTNFSSGYYGPDYSTTTAANIENALNYLSGISFVRDSGFFNYFAQGSFLQQIGQNSNVKFVLEISGGVAPATSNNYTSWNTALAQIALFGQNYPGYLLGIQGVNTAGFTLHGTTTDTYTYSQAINFQSSVYGTAIGLNAAAIQLELDGASAIVNAANYGLLDVFPDSIPSGGAYSTSPGGYLQDVSNAANYVTPAKPTFTQIGYQSFADNAASHQTGSNYVNQTTQAKYLLECLMDVYIGTQLVTPSAYRLWYQLYDTPLSSYGLFTGYGGTPKVSGQVLAGMMNLLKDYTAQQNSFVPGKLNYTVSGKPAQSGTFLNTGYKDLLLQGSNGVYYLLMCNQQALNTTGTDSEISVASYPVTLTLNEKPMGYISVIDLIAYGKFGLRTSTISDVLIVPNTANVSSVSFNLPPYPILVILTPSNVRG